MTVRMEDTVEKEVKVEINLRAKDLYSFLMRHTYTSFSGLFGVVISLFCLVLIITNYNKYDTMHIVALSIVVLYSVLQPAMLYVKAHKQAKNNGNISAALEYTCNDDGIRIRQGEQQVQVMWIEIRKVVQTAKRIYVYMSPVRAFIFPESQCGGQYEALKAIIRNNTEAVKRMTEQEKEAAWDAVTRLHEQMEMGQETSATQTGDSDGTGE